MDRHGPSLGRHRALCSCKDIVMTRNLQAFSTRTNVGLGSTYHVLLLPTKSLESLSSRLYRTAQGPNFARQDLDQEARHNSRKLL